MREHQAKPADEHDDSQHNSKSNQQSTMTATPRLAVNPAQRQAKVLQLQRTHGNKFVQRMLMQRAPANDDAVATAPAEGQSTPIGDGSVTLSAQGGVLNIQASAITGNVASTNLSGVLQADTIVADTVVGASYTPGAGNVM